MQWWSTAWATGALPQCWLWLLHHLQTGNPWDTPPVLWSLPSAWRCWRVYHQILSGDRCLWLLFQMRAWASQQRKSRRVWERQRSPVSRCCGFGFLCSQHFSCSCLSEKTMSTVDLGSESTLQLWVNAFCKCLESLHDNSSEEFAHDATQKDAIVVVTVAITCSSWRRVALAHLMTSEGMPSFPAASAPSSERSSSSVGSSILCKHSVRPCWQYSLWSRALSSVLPSTPSALLCLLWPRQLLPSEGLSCSALVFWPVWCRRTCPWCFQHLQTPGLRAELEPVIVGAVMSSLLDLTLGSSKCLEILLAWQVLEGCKCSAFFLNDWDHLLWMGLKPVLCLPLSFSEGCDGGVVDCVHEELPPLRGTCAGCARKGIH